MHTFVSLRAGQLMQSIEYSQQGNLSTIVYITDTVFDILVQPSLNRQLKCNKSFVSSIEIVAIKMGIENHPYKSKPTCSSIYEIYFFHRDRIV